MTVVHEILGLGRSGTTIVGRLVAQVTGAVPVDELVMVWRRGFLEDRPCTCGAAFSRCEHWQAVCATAPDVLHQNTAARVDAHIRALAGPGTTLRVLSARGRRALLAQTPAGFLEAHAAMTAGIVSVTGAPALASSSKSPALVWLLAQSASLDVRPLHVLRDPRAVAWSWEHPHVPADGEAPLPTTSAPRAAASWLLVNAGAEAVGRSLGGAPRVRLEQIAEDAGRLGRAIGVEQVHATSQRVVHTMAGNPGVRRSDEAPCVRLDDRWRREGWASRTLVTALTAPLLIRYGYPLRSR